MSVIFSLSFLLFRIIVLRGFSLWFLPENVFTDLIDLRLVSYSFLRLIFYYTFIWNSIDFLLMNLNIVFQFTKMARITCCKSLQKDMLTKDPNFGIFFDTSGRVIETYQIDWSRVYSIFHNDDLSNIQND